MAQLIAPLFDKVTVNNIDSQLFFVFLNNGYLNIDVDLGEKLLVRMATKIGFEKPDKIGCILLKTPAQFKKFLPYVKIPMYHGGHRMTQNRSPSA